MSATAPAYAEQPVVAAEASEPRLILADLEQRRNARSLRRRGALMRRLLLAADLGGLVVAFVAMQALIGSKGSPDAVAFADEAIFFAATLPLWIVGARLFGLYDRDEERADHSTSDDLVRVFLLVTVGVFIGTRLSELTGTADPDQMKATAFWAFAIAAVTGARIVARVAGRRTVAYLQNTIIVGAGEVGQLVARKLTNHPEFGLNLVGFVDTNPRERLDHVGHVPVLGALEELPDLVKTYDAERVIFAFTADPHSNLLALVRLLRDRGVQVDMVPRLFEVMGPRVDIHTIEGTALVGLPPVRLARSSRLAKRIVDVVVAGLALLVASPLLLLIALLVKLDSPGGVFFRQARLGEGMREFKVLKFRTMRVDVDQSVHREYIAQIMDSTAAPSENGMFKLDRPDAVTRVGRFLRRWSLDELPQLLNVLRGEMSLVGPRPVQAAELATHYGPAAAMLYASVRPGITGLWQVSARARSTFVEALDMDVLYAQSQSFGLDLRLLFKTPLQLLRSQSTA